MTFSCFLEFIALVRLLNLCIYPRFKRWHLNLIGSHMSLKDAAAVHLDRVCVSRQHQVNSRLDLLVAEDVRVDGLRAPERNNLLIAPERNRTRRANARAPRLDSFR